MVATGGGLGEADGVEVDAEGVAEVGDGVVMDDGPGVFDGEVGVTAAVVSEDHDHRGDIDSGVGGDLEEAAAVGADGADV